MSIRHSGIKRIHCLLLLFAVGITLCFKQESGTAEYFIDNMLTAIDNVKTARYVMKKQERIEKGSFFESELIIKLQSSPLKIYAYSVKPNPGAEALWLAGQNDGNVLVSPNKFPYIDLNLDP